MASAGARGKARPYKISKREVIAKTDALRITLFTMAPGETVPWHLHSEIADTFFCLEGRIGIETRSPTARHLLGPGERLSIPAATEHHVSNADSGRSRYLLVQGIGKYDFVPSAKVPK